MAQRQITLMTCDIHGDETEATDTIVFGIGSERFELDACEEHANEIRSTLARYAGLGRRTGLARSSGSAAGTRGSRQPAENKWGFSAGDLTSEERDFAVKEGWAGRGRISGEIMDKLAVKRG